MPSPKPKPPALKLIEGSRPGRDSGGRPVKPTPGFVRLPPQPPEWLPEEARDEWDRVVPELTRLELLKPIDRAVLTAYCLTWARMVQAYMDVASGNLTTKGSQGQLVKHPSVMVLESATRELRALAAEFGMTPSSENRLNAGKDGDGHEGNPFAAVASA
jgi:P27 family predicted phage terminase small subunit